MSHARQTIRAEWIALVEQLDQMPAEGVFDSLEGMKAAVESQIPAAGVWIQSDIPDEYTEGGEGERIIDRSLTIRIVMVSDDLDQLEGYNADVERRALATTHVEIEGPETQMLHSVRGDRPLFASVLDYDLRYQTKEGAPDVIYQ